MFRVINNIIYPTAAEAVKLLEVMGRDHRSRRTGDSRFNAVSGRGMPVNAAFFFVFHIDFLYGI